MHYEALIIYIQLNILVETLSSNVIIPLDHFKTFVPLTFFKTKTNICQAAKLNLIS